MKRLKGWDTYVSNAKSKKRRTLELPISDDEVYVIKYPTRSQGRKIKRAQESGDTDALLIALLGEQAGRRVVELSEDEPADVVDDLLLDVLRQFGFLDDESDESDDDSGDQDDDEGGEGKPGDHSPSYPEQDGQPSTSSTESS